MKRLYVISKNSQIQIRCLLMSRHNGFPILIGQDTSSGSEMPIVYFNNVPTFDSKGYLMDSEPFKNYLSMKEQSALILTSCMGSGKSQLFGKMISNARKLKQSVLYVSCRKSFSTKVSNEFKLDLYSDILGYIQPNEGRCVVV